MQTHIFTIETSKADTFMCLVTARTVALARNILLEDFKKSFGKDIRFTVNETYSATKEEHLEDYMFHHLNRGILYLFTYGNGNTSICHWFVLEEFTKLLKISKADHHHAVYILTSNIDEDIMAQRETLLLNQKVL